jgi:hypothetical protein
LPKLKLMTPLRSWCTAAVAEKVKIQATHRTHGWLAGRGLQLANQFHPEHTPFIFHQFDVKLSDWDLTSNDFFKKLWDKSSQY